MTLLSIGDLKTTRDERGATAVEYGLMVALIAAAIVTTVGLPVPPSTASSTTRSPASTTPPERRESTGTGRRRIQRAAPARCSALDHARQVQGVRRVSSSCRLCHGPWKISDRPVGHL